MFHHLRSAKSQIHYPLGCYEKFLEIPRRTSDLQSAAWENYQTGGSKVDLAFHPSEVDKMSTRNFWELVVKSKLPPPSGSSLEAVEPHP